jgi:hypothetical protein
MFLSSEVFTAVGQPRIRQSTLMNNLNDYSVFQGDGTGLAKRRVLR